MTLPGIKPFNLLQLKAVTLLLSYQDDIIVLYMPKQNITKAQNKTNNQKYQQQKHKQM